MIGINTVRGLSALVMFSWVGLLSACSGSSGSSDSKGDGGTIVAPGVKDGSADVSEPPKDVSTPDATGPRDANSEAEAGPILVDVQVPPVDAPGGPHAKVETITTVESFRATACASIKGAWVGTVDYKEPTGGGGSTSIAWDFAGGDTADLSFTINVTGGLGGTFAVTEKLTLRDIGGVHHISTSGSYVRTYGVPGIDPISGTRSEQYTVERGTFGALCP